MRKIYVIMYFLSKPYRQIALIDSVASIYAKFEVPYYPNNNDDYDYNWSDGLHRLISNLDSYGELAYFYHSGHLGSTSYVIDANGDVYITRYGKNITMNGVSLSNLRKLNELVHLMPKKQA